MNTPPGKPSTGHYFIWGMQWLSFGASISLPFVWVFMDRDPKFPELGFALVLVPVGVIFGIFSLLGLIIGGPKGHKKKFRLISAALLLIAVGAQPLLEGPAFRAYLALKSGDLEATFTQCYDQDYQWNMETPPEVESHCNEVMREITYWRTCEEVYLIGKPGFWTRIGGLIISRNERSENELREILKDSQHYECLPIWEADRDYSLSKSGKNAWIWRES